MQNKKWRYLVGLAAFFAFFATGVMAPATAHAAIDDIWNVGDNDAVVKKDGSLALKNSIELTRRDQTEVGVSTAITTVGTYKTVVSTGGGVISEATPTVSTTTSAGVALRTGKTLIIRGISDANAITLQDDDTLAGSQLELGASTRVLGLNDVIYLIWDADTSTTGRWLEVSYTALD